MFIRPRSKNSRIALFSVAAFSFSGLASVTSSAFAARDETGAECAARAKLDCTNRPGRIRRLCFAGKTLHQDPTYGRDLHFVCDPKKFETIFTDRPEVITETLRTIAATTCDRIADLVINDHGDPGIQYLGKERIDTRNVGNLFGNGSFACAFADQARITYGGCSVGHGCSGRLFLAATAKTIDLEGRVSVSGADTVSTNVFASFSSRSGSMNLRDVHLLYDRGHEHWSYLGLRGGLSEPLGETCLKVADKLYRSVQREYAELDRRGCDHTSIIGEAYSRSGVGYALEELRELRREFSRLANETQSETILRKLEGRLDAARIVMAIEDGYLYRNGYLSFVKNRCR